MTASGHGPRAIDVKGATAHNLKNVDVTIERGAMTVVTGVSGSGKSSLAFDTVLAEAQRRFFHTLSHYSRQFLALQARPPVRSISGLSPAISLAQNETMPSRRATVGTLTDVTELLGVLLARFGEEHCPTHDLPTSAQSADAIAARIAARADGATVAILAPIATDKKGTFKTALTGFAERGYVRAEIDGQLVMLANAPALAREERHTIKLIVDYVKIKDATKARLLRAVETALKEADGFVEWRPAGDQGALSEDDGGQFSAKGGCPTCGFSWPKLDARYFSSNSLGKCTACDGYGVTGGDDDADDADGDDDAAEATIVTPDACRACDGTGIADKMRGIRLAGKTPQALHAMPLAEFVPLLDGLTAGELGVNPAARRLLEEISGSLRRAVDIGLGYLSISRRVRSLSGGEAQRLKLAGILGDNLRGVLYVLDEPSQGLATAEIERLAQALHRLRDAGNTVLIVDHDETLMRHADWIIDLGPGGGARGGRVMAHFKPADAAHFTRQSLTARHLAGQAPAIAPPAAAPRTATNGLTVKNARLHNLDVPSVSWPLQALSVVTGISGAGKTSLVLGTLYAGLAGPLAGGRGAKGAKGPLSAAAGATISGYEGLTSVAVVDRKPIAKSGVSLPASYLGVLTELRDLYASLPDAQVMGLTARSFSLSVEGGRCPECKGRGELSLTMRFLADARVRCPVCQGERFRPQVLQVKWQGLSMADVLQLTLDEALELFQHHRRIASKLAPAAELGLGYLKLGQPSASLSGGEAQRLKLVPHLAKAHGTGSLLILDEPTTGLHFEDIQKLIAVLRRLTTAGATVITIEHHPDVIASADWLVELGPGSAHAGGKLVYAGPPRAAD